VEGPTTTIDERAETVDGEADWGGECECDGMDYAQTDAQECDVS
jgi:hypothetical protein